MNERSQGVGSGKARGRRSRGVLAAVAVAAALALGAASPTSDEAPLGVDGTRAALEKWVEARRLISQEKREWELNRELLAERAAVVRAEIAGLRERITAAEESLSEAETRRADLAAENEALQDAAGGLRERVTSFEARMRALLVRVPEPLRERVRPLSQRLPTEDGETKASLAERFQNVVGILNEVDKFQREVSVTTEVRELPDGLRSEVSVLYLGLAQAYYTTARGDRAGTGSGRGAAWTWTSRDDVAAATLEAIAVLQGDRSPTFVLLPIRVE